MDTTQERTPLSSKPNGRKRVSQRDLSFNLKPLPVRPIMS
jgi:hypothetical protein